jgi:DNA (cytosine-5)-methyltransferase 1
MSEIEKIYTIGSLFTGIGGIEIGFENQGYETTWMVEKDEYARTILRKQFPNATLYGDITEIDFRTIPKVDIITGGFPCQDISNAGKRVGITGSRSSLWKYYHKAIREIRPQYALIENVSALTKRGLDVVLSDLAEIGYDAEWYNISASAVGAPHRRERIFIIAYPNSGGYVCGEPEKQSAEGREQAFGESESSGDDVLNSNSNRKVVKRQSNSDEKRNPTTKIQEWKNKQFRTQFTNRNELSNWSTEPNVGRVANGISSRVERIKCLGNAVVPQVAEVFAKAIKEYEANR